MSRSWLIVGFKYPNINLLTYYLIDLTSITVDVYKLFLHDVIKKKLTKKIITHTFGRNVGRLLYVAGYSNKQIDTNYIIENLRENGRLLYKYYI